ncbi:hypothetical protein NQ176_g8703 [Zarea fungicola]|uniref:Uncharacterized protein n=1 Tax=Zarea fungicola TaxID=93591 RepID=A0ACC1MRT0_9HYPO|nr:hypothetical protein NQ176_g8703 [Lecanicillium fungicola]
MLASVTSILLMASTTQAAGRYAGTATFYGTNTGPDACTGKNHKSTDYFVALHPAMYKNGQNCGKKIIVTGVKSKKTITVTVVDECPTCGKSTDLDFTEGAFKNFATLNDGTAQIQWNFI